MKKNMGLSDRIIRGIVALIFATLYFTNTISGTLGLVLLVAAIIFVVTSFISFCPIYAIFGLKTCKIKK